MAQNPRGHELENLEKVKKVSKAPPHNHIQSNNTTTSQPHTHIKTHELPHTDTTGCTRDQLTRRSTKNIFWHPSDAPARRRHDNQPEPDTRNRAGPKVPFGRNILWKTRVIIVVPTTASAIVLTWGDRQGGPESFFCELFLWIFTKNCDSTKYRISKAKYGKIVPKLC